MPGLLDRKRNTNISGQDSNVEETANVSPEEQAQYNAFVENGAEVIYSEGGQKSILDSIAGGGQGGDGNPVEGLANALVMLVMRLEDSAEQAGTKMSGDVMLHGGSELLELMVEMAEEAGIHTFDDSEIESALYLALDTYRATRQQQGKLPEEQLQADFEEVQRAEQAGQLEEVIPGIGEYAKRAPKPGDAPPQGRSA